jgi:L-iditol 2-dehydrogenase
MAEFVSLPAVNCPRIPGEMPPEQMALVEPLGCVLHSCARMEQMPARFSFGGVEPVRGALICGAGPAGLLFLQYFREVKNFDGLILVSDCRDASLELVKTFGGVPVDIRREDPIAVVEELTHGEGIDLLIEACGNTAIFEQIPKVLKKQGTVLIYGNGHKGGDFRMLSNILFLEPLLIAAVGASGGFDPAGRPQTHRRALELISSGRIQVAPIITHRYGALEEIHHAFEEDRQREDYVKGVLRFV